MPKKPTFSQMPGQGRPQLGPRTELSQAFEKPTAAKSNSQRATNTTVIVQQPAPVAVPTEIAPAEAGAYGVVELSDAPDNGISIALTPNARVVQPFGPSGTDHAVGVVPDPGATPGTTKFLREDGTWNLPVSGSVDLLDSTGTAIVTGATAIKFENGTIVQDGTTPTQGNYTAAGGSSGGNVVVTQRPNLATYGSGYQIAVGGCNLNGYFFTDKARTDSTTYQIPSGNAKPSYPETLSGDLTASGIVSAFMLNEGSGTTVTGNDGRTGTLSGTTFTTTPDGTGVTLTGSNTITIPDTGFPTGNNDRAIVMRVKAYGSFANYFALFGYGITSGNEAYLLLVNGSGQPIFTQYGASSTSSVAINDGAWHTLILQTESAANTTKLYTDGSLTMTYGGTLNTTSSGSFNLGAALANNSQTMDVEFCYIYDRVLTLGEIANFQTLPYAAFVTFSHSITALYDLGAGVVTDAATILWTPLWENLLTQTIEISPDGLSPSWTALTVIGTPANNMGTLAADNFSATVPTNFRWARLSCQDSAGVIALGSFFIIGADNKTIGAYEP